MCAYYIYPERNPEQQIKIRAERIGTFGDSLTLLCETNLDTIKTVIDREKPQIVIIDSIQTMYNEEVSSAPGSVITGAGIHRAYLMQIAKGMGISIFIVGHVTKEGVVAGPESSRTHGGYGTLF